MFKLCHNYAHFTCQQGNAQNSSNQASTACELRTSRYTSYIQKRQRKQRSNCQTSVGSQKKQERFRKTFTSASLTTPKPLTLWITTNCGKFLKRYKYQTTLPAIKKLVCRTRSNSQNWTWNNRLFQNWQMSMSRLQSLC